MKYILLNYFDEKAWAALGEAEQQQIKAGRLPHVHRLLADGKFLGGAGLQPTSAAATVSLQNGKRLVTDGPFAETREQLAGYALIEATDLDEAINIAVGFLRESDPSRLEVRPLLEAAGVPSHSAEVSNKA